MTGERSARCDVLIASWGGGGNLPPLLAAGSLLGKRDLRVCVLASSATHQAAVDAGFDVVGYRRARDPDLETAFEDQAERAMATGAGLEIALDVRDAIAQLKPQLMIVDCMLPAALASGEAMGTPTASLVHFPYGLARIQMLRGAGAWTTDRAELNATRRTLGLEPTADALAAWESPDLLLVTAPKWFDLPTDYPAHVLHAGPLGVRTEPRRCGSGKQPLVLLSFSTTVMHGQPSLIQRVCDAIAGEDLQGILTLGPAVSAQSIRIAGNVEVIPYADHDQLLPGCAAVVTHGGLGTTLRALAHGKPMLLLPLGRDQEFNARRAVELAAGMHLPVEASPDEIASALSELLAQPRYAESAGRAAAAIVADRPDRTATEALLGLAEISSA
jgi:UDP:flavonoid glycosyltransferase YjiC (YdhE family)